MTAPVVSIAGVTKRFGATVAIDNLSAVVAPGRITGLVGPDGAGKTTLLRLVAGLLRADAGRIEVCGLDAAAQAPQIHTIAGYMPQRFGLYEDLTVAENLTLYADLRGVTGAERVAAFARLLAFTDLGSFQHRLAGRLSGGMKQKLGLACALIRTPRVLLLDEPSVGVDPISRRELWRMVSALVDDGLGVVWSTSYLDEAERCAEVLLLHEGHLLHAGPPGDMTRLMAGRSFLVEAGAGRRRMLAHALARPEIVDGTIQGASLRIVMAEGAAPPTAATFGSSDAITVRAVPPRFEDAYIARIGGVTHRPEPAESPPVHDGDFTPVIEARGLTKRFGSFTAADNISFTIARGEIFGLLGPNGAGKSTTFKMMCGLLLPTSGSATVEGLDLYRAASAARGRIGYMAQKFSLYGDLSVRQNLAFFAGVYGIPSARRAAAIARVVDEFALHELLDTNAGGLPLGFKQRLALACAVMHEPAVLFLDEPTSGVDPLTRRDFWQRINAMVERGVTIMVTTHFLDEAEYCDRIALVYHGRVIAAGSPDALKQHARSANLPDPTLEDAFIALVEADSPAPQPPPQPSPAPRESERSTPLALPRVAGGWQRARRIFGLIRKETLQILRDPSSIMIAGVLPLLFLFIFGFAVSLDLDNVGICLVVEQPTPVATSFAAALTNSRFFAVRETRDRRACAGDLVAGRIKAIVVVPAWFAASTARGAPAAIQVLVDGSDPNSAGLVQNYIQGLWQNWLVQDGLERAAPIAPPVSVASRVWFNPAHESRNFLLPGLVAVIMTLIGTLLTALVVAREWERGTMEALMSTPIGIVELLIGKLAPYFILGMGAMVLSVAASVAIFAVPFRGSYTALAAVSAVFLICMLAFGLFISTVTRNQFVASQAALIAGFLPALLLSGFLFEIGSMPLPIRIIANALPARYFVPSLQTLFLVGDVGAVLLPNAAAMTGMAVVLLLATARVTRLRLD